MQRVNAASCLLLVLLAQAAFPHGAQRVKVEVVQTHTGIRLGNTALDTAGDPDPIRTRCSGTSGVYSRELGYSCAATQPGNNEDGRGYAFFYDVSVIMPDTAHVVLHCSRMLSPGCEGFPSYPESTSVACSQFVYAGIEYRDCTASGPALAGIGVYEAALHGSRVTIFGSEWQRNYMEYGTWQFEDRDPHPQPEQAAQEQNPPASPATSPAAGPATSPAPGQDSKAANGSAPGSIAPAPAGDLIIDPLLIEQAKAGDPVAQYKLGYDYYLGHGIAQDYTQAAIWWRKAAEQGYPDAQNNLGVLYNSGKGVPQSYAEAYFWENLAAARANGTRQAEFAKNRDESGSKLWFLERLKQQRRAAKWAAEHPVAPRSHEPPASHP